MRNNESYISNAQNFFNERFAEAPDDEQHDSRPRQRKEYSHWSTIKQTIIAGGITAVVGGIATSALYLHGYVTELGPHQTVNGNILSPGAASVGEINLDIPAVPVAKITTKVGNVEVGLTKNITAVNGLINFPYENTTLERTASVVDTVSINASKVGIRYNAITDDLTFKVPADLALSSELNIPAGGASTVDGTAFKLIPQQDLMSSMANEIAGALKIFGDKNAGASKVPIIGGIAKDQISTHSELENFADLAIVNGVQDKCTNLVTTIPGFTEGMKANIIEAVRGILLDPNFTNDPAHKDLALLMDRPATELQTIVSKAKVELVDNYKIGPDQKNIDAYQKFVKSKFFKTNLGKSAITCTVKDAKLILPKKAPVSTSTPKPAEATK